MSDSCRHRPGSSAPRYDLAERFNISRNTVHKWINRFHTYGQSGSHEHSRRLHSCPWWTVVPIVAERSVTDNHTGVQANYST
ncbi:MAG: helix-turn-helix domain-containing protein [Anaerolineales bacterium]|nr:MAG: helix-turn-helix domain-containing protein [Anaerolineales bacterium]